MAGEPTTSGQHGRCIFCAIVSGEAPASIVHGDDLALAFMDVEQTNPGHVLVIPRQHYERLDQVPTAVAAHLFVVAQGLAEAVPRSGVRCEGVNVFLADGEAAGQDVPHVHLHVRPRFAGDAFSALVGRLAETRVEPTREELDVLADPIRAAYRQLFPAVAPPSPPATPRAERFDKFTERARKVLQLAQEEAQRLNHNYIGTEHLLIGLVREGDGIAAQVLANLGIALNDCREAVAFVLGRGERTVTGDIGLTPRAKKVIELSVEEARRLNHSYVGTEHLLLGLVREAGGIATAILESFGVELSAIRDGVEKMLAWEGRSGIPASPANVPLVAAMLTEPAKKAFQLAQEEAQRFNHNYVGTEHLLLGLIREGDSIAAKALVNLGADLHKVRSAVEFIVGRGERAVSGDLVVTPRARKVFEFSAQEAARLRRRRIGPEHLLLGLMREGEGIAAGVLESLGVSLASLRRSVEDMVRSQRRQ